MSVTQHSEGQDRRVIQNSRSVWATQQDDVLNKQTETDARAQREAIEKYISFKYQVSYTI